MREPAFRTRCSIVVACFVASAAAVADAQTGVGEVHFSNSGSPVAQDSFLAGLAQLHNFEYAAAAELFRKAQQTDPGFALAYWGEAMTFNHPVWMEQDRDAARKVLDRLAPTTEARLAKAPTPREKDYLRAVDILYGDGEKFARDFAYADAMAELSKKYPDDVDAAAFHALSLLGTAHAGRDFRTYMRAAAILEPLFPTHPAHPGIAHYLIHSYDDPVHAPLGLRAARAYSKIAPSAGHAQHMCSHIFVAMGMWDDVVAANEAAVAVVDRGRAAHGHGPSACGHYNFWLEYGYLQQGRYADAKKLVAHCYAAARAAAAPQAGPLSQSLDPDSSAIGSFSEMRTRYLLDTEDWGSDVVGWSVATGGQPRPEVGFEFATGYAAVRRGQRAAAASALARLTAARSALDAQLEKTPAAAGAEASTGPWAKILEDQLSALIQLTDGATAPAIARLGEVASLEEKLPYEFGPPFIDKPSYELLGEALLAAGRPKEARAAFEQSLARAPERTASLRGLMQAEEKLGDAKKATDINAKLRAIQHRADRP